ncbi:MAG: hypothetical protein IJO63_05350 [Bacilli bacterium]|nr:hypothetical protein [Bacilli bacterium]
MNRKNKTIVWLVLFIFLTVVFVSIATYAYFTAREVFYGSFDVEVNSKGVDTLSFNGSDDVSIMATANNFSHEFGHDLTGTATMNVVLETTNPTSTFCYELSVKLPDNKVFVYSDGHTPELLLNVSRSSDGKNYTDIISNMDITDKIGTIRIPTTEDGNKYVNTISTKKRIAKTDYWKADVTLVWLEGVEQTINDNKEYTATLIANRVECN